MRAVLAAQRQEQHAAGVGVAREGNQQLLGLVVVRTGLRATKGVREVADAAHGAMHEVRALLHHRASHLVHAAHRGDDPDLVARGGAAIRATEAHERLGIHVLGLHGTARRRVVAVLHLAGEVGLHVVRVQPGTRHDIGNDVADGQAVLDDRVTGGQRAHGHLVALRDVLDRRDGAHAVGHLEGLALRDRAKGHDHVVGGIDVYKGVHGCP